MNKNEQIINKIDLILKEVDSLDERDKVELINEIRIKIHEHSPFRNEPVDCVQWIKSGLVVANDYNPNKVAPPEMKLLERSIREDGYTQPIVAWKKNGDGQYEVIDGFHRNRVGKEIIDINIRMKGYLPITTINPARQEKKDRIAATIRHNRARGKHTVEGMSDIVLELKNRNWTNERIATELGMDPDEILRLCQITGLASLFEDRDFSKSWDIEDSETDEFVPIDSDVGLNGNYKHLNVDDENRIFHTYDKWECYKAGFYETTKRGMTRNQCEIAYRDFLKNTKKFAETLERIIVEWEHSCEHYLTNTEMNRIAYLGQAACCYSLGIPAIYRGGFNLLTEEEQREANETALIYLNKWLKMNGRKEVSLEEGLRGRQQDIY